MKRGAVFGKKTKGRVPKKYLHDREPHKQQKCIGFLGIRENLRLYLHIHEAQAGCGSDSDAELLKWIEYFEREKQEAALAYWYEIHKGIHESLREF